MFDWWTRMLVALGLAAAPGGTALAHAEPLYPEAIVAPEVIPAQKATTVRVEGNLPSPAYELLPPQVTVEPPLLRIRLGAKLKHTGPSIQMLQPFSLPVELPPLAAGRYELVVEAPKAEPVRRALRVGN